LKEIAEGMNLGDTFQATEGAIFYGEPGVEVPDPYFNGEGPSRKGCIHCGGCMVGCRHNAKNNLTKNYLYLAEKWGAKIWAECEVQDVRPLPPSQPDGARYEILYRLINSWSNLTESTHCNVVFSQDPGNP
jgi:cholesterol oxidase